MTSRADQVQAETVRLAEMVAATEDLVAETMDALAEQHPDRAEHLRARGDDAREQAVRQRQWAEDLRGEGVPAAQDEQA